MSAHPAPAQAGARPVLHISAAAPQSYCPIPQRLITDLHDTPLAIGLYALVGRLFFVAQAPVPLSVPDVMRYDPTLSRGALIRAFHRLSSAGWLIEAGQRGHKTRYTPTWGCVKGAPLAWQIAQPCLGRPRHVPRLMLDRALLDVCMGKLTLHPVLAAPITRYVTVPAHSLTDVGCYALTLAGLPRETPALRWLGLVKQGQACPLPAEPQLLALISQRPLALDGTAETSDLALTAAGTRKLGMAPAPASAEQGRAQPLFFVPPAMIGSMIRPMIGSMIDQDGMDRAGPAAPACAKHRSEAAAGGITWESRESRDAGNSPPTPPHGGGGVERELLHRPAGPASRAEASTAPEFPKTEAAQLLRAINVLPAQLLELAHLPAKVVQAAIADGSARAGVRDLAGWVVALLRAHRDGGWAINPPAPRAESPQALAAAFARYAAEQRAAQEESAALPAPDLPAVPEAMPPHEALWESVLAALRSQLPRPEFAAWLRPATLRSVAGDVATVAVPDVASKAALEARYLALLRLELAEQLGRAVRVRIVLSAPQLRASRTQPAGRLR